MQKRIKKKFDQLRFSDLVKHNNALGCPIRESLLHWIYSQLKSIGDRKNISVRSVEVTDRERMAALLIDNALSKEFIMPDPEIYYYN